MLPSKLCRRSIIMDTSSTDLQPDKTHLGNAASVMTPQFRKIHDSIAIVFVDITINQTNLSTKYIPSCYGI